MGYNLYEIAHECDWYHTGHRRALDGTCKCNGELLTGWPCDVHGPSRRMPLREWLESHGQPLPSYLK